MLDMVRGQRTVKIQYYVLAKTMFFSVNKSNLNIIHAAISFYNYKSTTITTRDDVS